MNLVILFICFITCFGKTYQLSEKDNNKDDDKTSSVETLEKDNFTDQQVIAYLEMLPPIPDTNFQFNMTTNAILLDKYMTYLAEKKIHSFN